MKQSIAIYPGTFDPPTLGHVDIAWRCLPFFKKLYIGVGVNSLKRRSLFSQAERVELLQRIFDAPQVEVVAFDGLLVDFVESHAITAIIRAVRTSGDIDFEIAQASLNRRMADVETFWICASPEYRDISSTLVQEIGRGGRDIAAFVPGQIAKDVERRLVGR